MGKENSEAQNNEKCNYSFEHRRMILREPSKTLIDLWYDANDRCRGGSGDAPLTMAACAEREKLSSRLESLGRYYGKLGQIGAEMEWHICQPNSIHAEGTANCVIADPSPTPLNLRTSPNGKIIGTIANGERTRILDRARDRGGDEWVYISDATSQPLGWVFRRYIVCK